MLQQHDQASKRMVQTMLEISRVLTPEQRTKWDARMKSFQERMDKRMADRADKK